MPQKRSFRLGWQSQNLARFLLYKFSFLAEPVQVADDIGIDFFCTLFEAKPDRTNSSLIPRNSFAIQIKSMSSSNRIDLTRYLPYLMDLELPFFIGIIDRTSLAMTIYSGQLLTPFFAYKGPPSHLEAELCERSAIEADNPAWNKKIPRGGYALLFPKVVEISASMEHKDLVVGVNEIQKTCALMLRNIASYIRKEFILEGAKPGELLLFAGRESLQFFQANFLVRLAEVFNNLSFAYSSSALSKGQVADLFQLYEGIYLRTAQWYGRDQLPTELNFMYETARSKIGGLLA